MKELSLDEFRKLSSDKKAMELFVLLRDNNKLLQETAGTWSDNHSHGSARSFQTKLNNKLNTNNSNSSSHGKFWKNALNLNSDLHDPWINLFKGLYGDDYFDRIRSLSKSKSETAILNVGGERHEVTFQTLAKLPDTRLAKLRSAKTQAELNTLCDRSVSSLGKWAALMTRVLEMTFFAISIGVILISTILIIISNHR